MPENLLDQTGALVRKIAGTNGMALEQYMDFFGGKQFRRSMLMRSDQTERTSRRLGGESLAALHLSSGYQEVQPSSGDATGPSVTFEKNQHQFEISNPVLIDALRILELLFPDTLTPDEIRQALIARGVLAASTDPLEIQRMLFSHVAQGRIQIACEPYRGGRADDPKPAIWPLARWQAASGQGWVSTRNHGVVTMTANTRPVFELIDGSRDGDALLEAVIDGLLDGRLTPRDGPVPQDTPRDRLRPNASVMLTKILQTLQRQALLVPASPA